MNKEEIKKIFEELKEKKEIEFLAFLSAFDETLLPLMISSPLFKSEGDFDNFLKEKKILNWKLGYAQKLESILNFIEDKKTKDLKNEIEKKDQANEIWLINLISLEFLNELKRAKADLINYKKEENERITHLLQISKRDFLLDLIPVLDSLEMSILLLKNENEKTGTILIRNQLLDILKKYGLEKIDARIGEKFDPSWQEALSLEEDEEENIILKQISSGYKFYDKILRPAQVIVSKSKKGH